MFRKLIQPDSPAGIGAAVLMIVAITIGHYTTDMHDVAFHNVYRRLYYLPIVLAAFARGLGGGLAAAVVVSVAYVPHAFLMKHHHDPAPDIDKGLEIVLYLLVAGLTGWLVEQQRDAQRALERALDERDALEKQLVRAGKLSALGELTAGLAHEIRNPLASIMGSAEALATEFDETHRKHRIANVLLREIDRLNRVVSDFLAFARPVPPQHRSVDLYRLVKEVMALARHRADSALSWSVDFDAGELVLFADPDQLHQVVLNLALNAMQALEDAEVAAPQLTFIARDREVAGRRQRCLGVVDNGPGIPEERQETIFHPYFTTREQGSGLGLSISSRIAEAHGGFLDVESQPGRTVFWLCLPDTAQERT